MKYSEMKKAAEKAGALKDLTPTFFEFSKKGDGFAGKLRSVSTVQSGLGKGEYCQYLFDTDEGLVKCAFGAATDKELSAFFEPGRVFSVEFLGKIKISGGRSVNKFKILEIDPSLLPKGEGEEDLPF